MGILLWVMNAMNSRDVIHSILKSSQTEQVRLNYILSNSMLPQLRLALTGHLARFHNFETEAHCLATQRGWDIPDLSVMAEFLTEHKTRNRLRFHKTDSHIAAIAIMSNTQAMISHLQIVPPADALSTGISILSQRYLDCIQEHIRQLKPFL